jgi:hypothetical protein
MRRALSALTLAATAFAATTLYRQWKSRGTKPAARPHALESWENEGGAVPERRTKKTPL